MYIMCPMGLFMVLPDVIDDLHVFVVVTLKNVFVFELKTKGILQDKTDILSAF